MTGEVQNILKGSVVTTVEYDTGRRLIGVSTSNLIPSANGVAPLSKQGAFQVPEKADTMETVDFVQAISNVQGQDDIIAETVDLPMLDQQPAPLKEPVHSDVITENPVQVENTASMGSFDLPSIEMPIQPEQPVEEVTPVAMDIQMPQMTEAIVADEPTGTNDQIFEGSEQPAPTSILESTPVAEVAPITETPVAEVPEVSPTIEMSVNTEIESSQNVVPEITMPTETPVSTYEPPIVDIQLPVIEEKKNKDIMESIPTTTPDTTIPSFNIDIPVINVPGEENKMTENKTDDVTTTIDNPTIGQDVTQESTEVEPVVEQSTAIRNEVPPVEAAQLEPVPEVAEPVEEIAEEKANELPQEESKEEKKEAEGLKEIIHQHRVIIENCATAIAKIAEELQKAAKSLEELETKTMEIASEKIETAGKVEEIVQQGNTLINEAFDRINAISGPKL